MMVDEAWWGYLTIILSGAWITVEVAVLASVVALIAAFLAGLGRISSVRAVRWISVVYIEFFRGTSVFVQLFWAYFVLPFFGLPLTPLEASILALGLNAGAYGAEIVRGAVLAIPREQLEAAVALNLTRRQRLRHVILPQALVLMLPPFTNMAVELVKGTAIVSLVSLSDMTFQAQVVRMQTGSTALPFVTILLVYFSFACAITAATKKLERRLSKGSDGLTA